MFLVFIIVVVSVCRDWVCSCRRWRSAGCWYLLLLLFLSVGTESARVDGGGVLGVCIYYCCCFCRDCVDGGGVLGVGIYYCCCFCRDWVCSCRRWRSAGCGYLLLLLFLSVGTVSTVEECWVWVFIIVVVSVGTESARVDGGGVLGVGIYYYCCFCL